MNVTTVGIDLAKNVFSVHGVDAHGKVALKKTLSRGKLLECFTNLPPCIVGMEACSGAHHWARQLRGLGHDARIIAPRFVIPYRKSGKIDTLARHSEAAQRLMTLPGVGAVTATALVASIANPKQFDNGRQLAAWLGLVPRQYSTGGKTRLGRITKQGDKYLRMLLIHGARSVLAALKDKQDRISCWLRDLIARRGLQACGGGAGSEERAHRLGAAHAR
jgi:transposase